MSIAEIRGLPLREKLQIFEAIWDDLSERVDQSAVTPELREHLDARIERVRNGSVEVHEWDSVKYSIGQQ